MDLHDRFQFWNCTPAERRPDHPADAHAPADAMHFVRAVDVDAGPETVFRWLCQLKVAPYSYDALDNLGRRSPRTLTPGVDRLAVGQRFLITRIVDFVPGRHITGVSTPVPSAVFGRTSLSYEVVPGVSAQSRIVVCMAVQARTRLGRLRRSLLGVGDLVMMRKQLLTLKLCAEDPGSRQTRPPDSEQANLEAAP